MLTLYFIFKINFKLNDKNYLKYLLTRIIITASEFGVLNAVVGIRKMLPLVFSKEATIRDGVMQAYKRLYINIDAPNER